MSAFADPNCPECHGSGSIPDGPEDGRECDCVYVPEPPDERAINDPGRRPRRRPRRQPDDREPVEDYDPDGWQVSQDRYEAHMFRDS